MTIYSSTLRYPNIYAMSLFMYSVIMLANGYGLKEEIIHSTTFLSSVNRHHQSPTSLKLPSSVREAEKQDGNMMDIEFNHTKDYSMYVIVSM